MTDALVSTSWVAERLDEPGTRVIEVSITRLQAYDGGHLPGAVAIDWQGELIEREDESSGIVIDPERFAALARRLGLRPEDTLVFYGDAGGRHAARAFWTFEYYRHSGPLHLMDGGREAWEREGRPLTAEAPAAAALEPSDYAAPLGPDESLRATREELAARLGEDGFTVLDTRTRGEYEGTDVRSARGGHMPGAAHVFWEEAVAADGSFRPRAELAALYGRLAREGTIAAHCQLGVRSVHTWFVLRHILGYPNVKNYDGSWQEWGNRQDTAIER